MPVAELLQAVHMGYCIADRAYDSRKIVDQIEAQGGVAVIPSQTNRIVQRQIDKTLYKQRNRIERFFCRLKEFRRVATRYDKLARHYASFLLVACGFIWIR